MPLIEVFAVVNHIACVDDEIVSAHCRVVVDDVKHLCGLVVH